MFPLDVTISFITFGGRGFNFGQVGESFHFRVIVVLGPINKPLERQDVVHD